MIWRSKAYLVAFAAFAYGAVVYGPVNVLVHHHDAGSLHDHDARHHATVASSEVPAHCLFCLDGIAPQPTELIRAIAAERHCHVVVEPAQQTARQRHSSRSLLPPSRAPPVAIC